VSSFGSLLQLNDAEGAYTSRRELFKKA